LGEAYIVRGDDQLHIDGTDMTWEIYVLLLACLLMSAWFGARLIEVLGQTGNPRYNGRLGFLGFERPAPIWNKAPAHIV